MALFAERSSAWPYAVGKLVSSKPYFFKISSAQSHAFSSTLSSQKRHVFCSLKEEGIQSMASSAKRAPWIPEICRLKAHIPFSIPAAFFTKIMQMPSDVFCSLPSRQNMPSTLHTSQWDVCEVDSFMFPRTECGEWNYKLPALCCGSRSHHHCDAIDVFLILLPRRIRQIVRKRWYLLGAILWRSRSLTPQFPHHYICYSASKHSSQTCTVKAKSVWQSTCTNMYLDVTLWSQHATSTRAFLELAPSSPVLTLTLIPLL